MSDFSNIPSQFDNLDSGHPIVFISYSWDNEDHKTWVRKLADDLRTKYSINVLLDQYNRGGYDLIHFMNHGITISNRVLLIGTPTYKEKSDKYDSGAKYEDQLISIELYHKLGSSKFIPILREGKFDTSFKPLIETRTGFDMRDDQHYDSVLYSLAAELWNNPLNAAPALGSITNFFSNSNISPNLNTKDLFVSEVKRLLSAQNGEIAFTELIENETKEAYKSILKNAKYDFYITPDVFSQYVDFHFNAVEKLLAASIPVVRFGSLKQQQLFVDAMIKLCMKPFVNGEITMEGSQYLHLLASMFLFHAIGLSCVKFGYYQILEVIMKTKVPAGNILSPNYSYSLAYLLWNNYWKADTLNSYLKTNWLYPFSELIWRKLYPLFTEYTVNEENFKCIYCSWEHLFSLLFNYYNCGIGYKDWFPTGIFVLKRSDLYRMQDNFYTSFLNNARNQQNKWTPLQQNLFDGSYNNFKRTYDAGEEFYKRTGRY